MKGSLGRDPAVTMGPEVLVVEGPVQQVVALERRCLMRTLWQGLVVTLGVEQEGRWVGGS